ncbi:MAG TPA: SMP-30/gluconolactonase/LRE family protein [Anaerolineaceae bacterium]|nr:SMP-30/gluconolactonase/LRE family protein [Anaerolineaceae bacterium]
MNEPEHLFPAQNLLGETPIWVPEENALYWVDWGGGPFWRFEPETGRCRAFSVKPPVTALARRSAGGWIAIAQDGLYAWDPQSNQCEQLAGPPKPDQPEICYNDGAVDRQGRLLVGTVNMEDVFASEGALYRFDPDGSLHQLDAGYATANGIGVSPDGKTLFVTDMRHHQVIALDYDPQAGEASRRRVFARVPEDEGMPDGLIVDVEGYVWSGHWGGWRLTRYDPDGKVERQICFPVEHVISFAFGGRGLDELFVTTAAWGFSDAERSQQPWAGDLFRLRPGVCGLAEPAFAG